MEDKKIMSIKCESCGAPLETEADKPIGYCRFCGARYDVSQLSKDDKEVELAKVNCQAYIETEKIKQQYEFEKNKQETEWREKQQMAAESKEKSRLFKKSKLRILIIIFLVFFIICAVVAFNDGKTPAAIIAVVQIVLAVFALLAGSGVIKLKIPGLHIIATILSVILIVPFMKANSYRPEDKPVAIQWEEIVLEDVLPTPPSDKGQIIINTSDNLYVRISEISEKQYNDYKNRCIEKGFDVDKDESGSNFTAYSEDGYKLSMYYFGYSKELTIDIEAPMELGEIEWPNSKAGKMIPAPKSSLGKFSYEYADHFFVYIGNTKIEDYNAYVKDCAARGFDVDYQKGDDYYYADNDKGYRLSLNYLGNNVMSISISASEESEDAADTADTADTVEKPQLTAAETTAESSVTNGSSVYETDNTQTSAPETTFSQTDAPIAAAGIRPEFKEAMDAYEAFYDEYISFMKKYQNADAMELISLLGQYSDFIDEMDEWSEKISKLEDDMNAEEFAYYAEVTIRIENKLLELTF